MTLIRRSVLPGCGAMEIAAVAAVVSTQHDGPGTSATFPPERISEPARSPDGSGQRRLFQNRTGGESSAAMVDDPFNNDNPAFGPDSFVYFRSNRNGNPDVFRMNTDGSGQELVISSPGDDYPPRWSPDGARGVYMSDRSGDWEIYRYERSTGRSVRLTQHPGRDWDPWWSPDGSSIAFMREVDPETGHDSWQIFGMAAGESGQRALLTDGGPNYWPVWSHDGRSLLFLSSRTGTAKMYVRAADGAVRPVEDAALESFGARFSPDGSTIAFGSRRDGNLELYLIHTSGRGLRRLTNHPARETYGAWAPDGQWIWFDSNRTGNSEIFLIRPDGTGLEQITNQNGQDDRASGGPHERRYNG